MSRFCFAGETKKLIKISPLKQGDKLLKQAGEKNGKRKSLLFKDQKKTFNGKVCLFICLFYYLN